MFQIHVPETKPNPLDPFAYQRNGMPGQLVIVPPSTVAPFTTPDFGTIIPDQFKPINDAIKNAGDGINAFRAKVAENEVNIIAGVAGFLILSIGVAALAGRQI